MIFPKQTRLSLYPVFLSVALSVTSFLQGQTADGDFLLHLDFRKQLPVQTAEGDSLESVIVNGTQPKFSESAGALIFDSNSWKAGFLRLAGTENAATLAGATDALTISALVKLAPSSGDSKIAGAKQALVSRIDAKEKAGWFFGNYVSGKLLFFWARENGTAVIRMTKAALFRPGEWHRVSVVWKTDDMNGLSFFVDGYPADSMVGERVVRAKGTATIPADKRPITIGATDDGRYPFRGEIRDVRIYNRALSAGELLKLSLNN
ncbi:LamG domain-containing protein [Opitutaceae bacterium TAV4]|nr:LamG domain-containing protein [Opitutaceae bacterium TAV4]RRK01960.1 LamG domain-containing protein [Opitutaceae bacterium TAV3]